MNILAVQSELANISKKYDLEFLVLFGSQATGKTHPKSDIDLGYVASSEMELSTSFQIEIELCKVLGRQDIDFVNLRKVSPLMKKIIADEGVVLYEQTPGLFVRFCMYAFKLYIETQPLRELRYQSLRNFAYGYKA